MSFIRPRKTHHCTAYSIFGEIKDYDIYPQHWTQLTFYEALKAGPDYEGRQLIWLSNMNKL